MNFLVTSDLHFTDHDQDSYRWELFPFLKEQISKYDIKTIFILGDLTMDKHNHSADLVNRIVDELTQLAKDTQIYLLVGNHDFYQNNLLPFFKFLSQIPNLHFIIKPTPLELDGKKYLLLPNCKNPLEEWIDLIPTFNQYDLLFMHQTVNKAIAENGMELPGLSTDIFNNVQVISGDIHNPQSLKTITYVGSPFHISFGCKFIPRILVLKDGIQSISISTPFIKKHTISISHPDQLDAIELPETDQVKLIIQLTDVLEWDKTRKAILTKCKEKKLNIVKVEYTKSDATSIKQHLEQQEHKLKSLSPRELLDNYCNYAKVTPELKEYGIKLLED